MPSNFPGKEAEIRAYYMHNRNAKSAIIMGQRVGTGGQKRSHGIAASLQPILLYVSKHRPFLVQFQSSRRQFALENGQRLNVDGGFEFTVASVKVGRRAIVEEHS